MSRTTWVALGVAALAVLGTGAVVWLSGPAEPTTEEAKIRRRFDEAAKAAAERKVDEVVELLSPSFQGRSGELEGSASRDDVKRLLAFELLRGKWVSVRVLDGGQVVVRGREARAVIDAVLSRAADPSKGLSDLLPGEYSLHRFELGLAQEDGGWRIVSGTWRPISLQQALSGPDAPDW